MPDAFAYSRCTASRFVVSTAIAAGVALASACAHAPPRTAAEPQPCTGRRMLVVHNRTDVAVDVYAYSRGASREILGTASPGDHELYLGGATAPFVATVADGDQIVAVTGSGGPHVMDHITFETTCRSA